MEERIENYIDRGLENVAPILYILSIVGGLLLIIIGFSLIIKNKTTANETKKIIGILMIGIGLLALFSGIIQSLLS